MKNERQQEADCEDCPRRPESREEDGDSDCAAYDAEQDCDHGNVAVGAFGLWGFTETEGAESDAERSGDDAERLENADNARGGDCSNAHEAYVVAIDFNGSHLGDGNQGGVDRDVGMTADKPDGGRKDEVGKIPPAQNINALRTPMT